MNNIKATNPKTGVTFIFKANQRRDLRTHPFHGEYWNSPAQLKAKILSKGLVLSGVRQS